MPDYNWAKMSKEHGDGLVLPLQGDAEGWVLVTAGPLFEAALLDLSGNTFLWTGRYTSLSAAKRGLIAAAKRNGCLPPEQATENEPCESQVREAGSAKSIWEWEEEICSFCTWIEGNGLGIDGVVTERTDGLFEGDVLIDTHCFRVEYDDELSARRGVLIRARALVDQVI